MKHKLIDALETYWKGSEALRRFSAVDPTSPEGAPSVEYLAEKMARAVVWKEKFIVGAIGSSVTAGHDNCAYDSYENQLERTMAKVWEAAGVEWEVRNAGEGGGCGDSFRNQIFCTRQMVGDDVDAIHYSWTYFESTYLYPSPSLAPHVKVVFVIILCLHRLPNMYDCTRETYV